MLSSNVHDFLEGTFLPDQRGYFFASPPPVDLLGQSALHSSDSWVLLSALLERAKRGDFIELSRLAPAIHASTDGFFALAAIHLLGDVGTVAAVNGLLWILEEEEGRVAIQAVQALQHVGELRLASSIAALWGRLEGDERWMLAVRLSEMLESTPGPIDNVDPFSTSADEFAEIVGGRVEELMDELGDDRCPVWAGRRFGVRSLAQSMIEIIDQADNPTALRVDFYDLRRRLEASTGVDCSQFYRDTVFQPLAARALLEELLESGELDRYEEGARYFFGHRIEG